MESKFKNLAGCVIVIEGVDGCGKSTVADRLFRDIRSFDLETIRVREPGDTYYGEKVRMILLDDVPPSGSGSTSLTPMAEMFLFMAARAQLMEEVVIPAVEHGKVVIADRSFLSTLAYQGEGGGIDRQIIMQCAQFAIPKSAFPDIMFILDVPPLIARERMAGKLPDRIEAFDMNYHARVRRGYLRACVEFPNAALIDASGSAGETYDQVLKELEEFAARRPSALAT